MAALPDLSRLLRPRSIVVVGGKPALEVVRQNVRLGYAGRLFAVHPRLNTIEGATVVRSLDALPDPPDAVFLAVNRNLTVEMLPQLAALGAGGVVAYAAGFAEAGPEGAALQAALKQSAGALPVLGPNCYGLLNYLDGAALWPDQHGGVRTDRGVAILTQSGNIGLNLTMQRRGLPLAYLVTMGNQAVVGLSAALATLARDDRVTAIGLHIEGIDDPAAFADAALLARAHGKPVVALKTGGSAEGARLAVSHTASLAGGDAAVDAFLRRVGVARVGSVTVMLEALKLLHWGGPLAGRSIASMSCSGGEAALMADRAERAGVALRPFTAPERDAVAATLPELVTISNPLDYHTFSWANGPALEATFGAVMRAGFDLTALILDYPRTDRGIEADWLVASDALAAARAGTGGRAAVIATLPECMPEARAVALAAAGVVPLCGLDEALAAVVAAADAGMPVDPTPPLTARVSPGAARLLDEVAGKRALSAYGVAVPDGRIVSSAEAAVEAALALGFPVVAKAVSADIAHKTERGAVRLNLQDVASVRAAANGLLGMADRVLVEAMVPDAVAEVIVGVTRDPAVGPALVLGSGGVLAELVADTATLAMPATADTVRAALAGLRVARLLAGHRGRKPGDTAALLALVLAVQNWAVAHMDRLLELDVNPVMVRPEGHGAVAVDVLIRLAEDPAT